MKKTGEFGEFFPASMSPWAYNETVAIEYFPLNKEDAKKQGFTWYENPNERKAVPQTYTIPDHIRDVPDSILNEILACTRCGKNYKIIAQELKHYKEQNIPIPLNCPDCRHRDRIARRATRRLFERACTKCRSAIQSPYQNTRPEKVYCSKCYLETVY